LNTKHKNHLIFSFGCLIFTSIFFFAFSGKSHAGPEGLVGAWLFDEGKGNVAEDVSENGHDGKINGAEWVDGKFGKALKFDGDGAVVIPHSEDLTSETYTIAAWVKCKNQGTWQTVISKTHETEGPSTRNYSIFVWPNTGVIHTHAGPGGAVNSTEKITDGNWHYVVSTRDKEGKRRGYIDGKNFGEVDAGKPGENDEDVSIGASGGGVRFFMIGAIDEPAIFDSALSEVEINDLMNNGLKKTLTLTAVSASHKLTTTWGYIKENP